MVLPFLDTNILLRHLRGDHPRLSPKATSIIRRIEQGKLRVRTADTVIFETIFTLKRTYKQPKEKIVAALAPILELAGIVLPGKRRFRKIFDLYLTTKLGFVDCYHLVLMNQLKIKEILSFDTDFDDIPNISRREE